MRTIWSLAADGLRLMSYPEALLIHSAAIGDFLISLRVIELLNTPEAPLRWSYLGKPPLGSLARSLGRIERHFDFEVGPWHCLFQEGNDFPKEFVPFFGQFSLIVNVLAGPDERVSQNLTRLAQGRIHYIEPKLPKSYSEGHYWHWLARQVDPDRAQCLPTGHYRPGPTELADAKRILKENRVDAARAIFLHPGASSLAKRWPASHFVTLAKAILAKGLAPVFLMGPVEQEQFPRGLTDEFALLGPVRINLPLDVLAAMLHLGRAYVGNDSGISHLAGMVGARTMVVFTSTSARLWRPLGPRIEVIDRKSKSSDGQVIDEIVHRLCTID